MPISSPLAPRPGPVLLIQRPRAAWLAPILLLAGCTEPPPPPDPAALIRPVRVLTVETGQGGEQITLSGRIEAQDQVTLAFRIAGRMIERNVNVGDRVRAGQVVARLESATWRDALQTARADLTAARARLTETRNQYQRFQQLIRQGFITRAMFDEAEQAFRSAEAQVDAAQARVRTAETQLSYTDLLADGPGTVTARGAEPGEVVAAGQMVVQLAREGGRDAVIDVPIRIIQRAPADLPIEVSLNEDPTVRAQGLVREVAPQADPITRTFRVRVGLIDPPPAMRLGATITASARLGGADGAILIPAVALTASQGQPAVWVLDPESMTVSARNLEIARYDLAQVAVASGLSPGEVIVTAGVQTLRPGQQVRLAAGVPLPEVPPPAADRDAEPPPAAAADAGVDAGAGAADGPDPVPVPGAAQ